MELKKEIIQELPQKPLQIDAIFQTEYNHNGVFVKNKKTFLHVSDEGIAEVVVRQSQKDGNAEMSPERCEITGQLTHFCSIEDDTSTSEQLYKIYEKVKSGEIEPPQIDPIENLIMVLLMENSQDQPRRTLHGAHPRLDDLFINLHGNHYNYIKKYKQISAENGVLKHVHETLKKNKLEVWLTEDQNPMPLQTLGPNCFGCFDSESQIPKYRLFVTEGQVCASANIADYEMAKEYLATRQVESMAGHETFHFVYRQLFSDEDRQKWRQYIKNSEPFQHLKESLQKSESYERMDDNAISEEIFAYRMHFHTFGKAERNAFSYQASEEEIDLLKELTVLPPDYTPNPALLN